MDKERYALAIAMDHGLVLAETDEFFLNAVSASMTMRQFVNFFGCQVFPHRLVSLAGANIVRIFPAVQWTIGSDRRYVALVETCGGIKMSVAKPLSIPMRDLLIEHIDGPVPFNGRIVPGSMTENRDVNLRCRALVTCIDRRWLTTNQKVSPTSTLLTDQGREVLCEALANWADALSRANWSLELGGLIPERATGAETKS